MVRTVRFKIPMSRAVFTIVLVYISCFIITPSVSTNLSLIITLSRSGSDIRRHLLPEYFEFTAVLGGKHQALLPRGGSLPNVAVSWKLSFFNPVQGFNSPNLPTKLVIS